MFKKIIDKIDKDKNFFQVKEQFGSNFKYCEFYGNKLFLVDDEFSHIIQFDGKAKLIYQEKNEYCEECEGLGGFFYGDPQGEYDSYACEKCNTSGVLNFKN